jgi:tetratricopeptide (TPR) repeat protein
MKRICIIVFVLSALHGFTQSRKIDSLLHVLKSAKEDTNKVNTLDRLVQNLWKTGKYDTATICANDMLALAGKLNFKKGQAEASRNIGIIYAEQSNFTKGLEWDNKTLALDEEIGNKAGIGKDFCEIGAVYRDQGNYPKALEYHYKALATDNEAGIKAGIASDECGIGIVYEDIGNSEKALEFYLKALTIAKETVDKTAIAALLCNISDVYISQGKFTLALDYQLKALAMNLQTGNKRYITTNYGDLGDIYNHIGDNTKALECEFKAVAISREIGDPTGIAINFNAIGNVYIDQKKIALAKAYFDSSIAIAKEIGGRDIIENSYGYMAKADSTEGNYKAYLADYKKYIIYRDSLVNEASTQKTVQTEMNFEFDQKQAEQKAAQDKKDAMAELESKKQKVVSDIFIAGFILMLALAFFIFRGYRQKQSANIIITQQKEEVEKQKALVEEKNKDILDSIMYAKQLQDAILPPLIFIKQHLPESFVFYKPKDIVAGDFYWMEIAGDTLLIAAADCTGHGVPGALVSIVCSNALNRAVKEFKIKEPGKILDKVRELVLETFEKSESNVQDGMDISLCAIQALPSPKGGNSLASMNPPSEGREAVGATVQWSGANNVLWYVQNNARPDAPFGREMKEIPADKQPIGKYYNDTSFNTHTLNLKKGDTLYLFTDGYADQFGGDRGKKLKNLQFQQILLANTTKPMDEQKRLLENALNEWKGNLTQVDDILVIGIRV